MGEIVIRIFGQETDIQRLFKDLMDLYGKGWCSGPFRNTRESDRYPFRGYLNLDFFDKSAIKIEIREKMKNHDFEEGRR